MIITNVKISCDYHCGCCISLKRHIVVVKI